MHGQWRANSENRVVGYLSITWLYLKNMIGDQLSLDRRWTVAAATGDEFKIILKQMSCDTFSLIYLQTNEYSWQIICVCCRFSSMCARSRRLFQFFFTILKGLKFEFFSSYRTRFEFFASNPQRRPSSGDHGKRRAPWNLLKFNNSSCRK